jgi:DNA-binding winged helix-turn-helix (wHTH) protein/TolB-like protein/Tfp pilus assembly protein PilF
MNEPQFQIYEFDEFRVDVSKRLITKGNGEQIQLTPKVFDTLLYLVRHGGKVIGKDELMREIWTDSIVEENNLNQNISILRRVFGEKPGEQRFIVTVPGHGYRFVPEVRPLLNTGFGITDIQTNETVSEDETARSEKQITDDQRRKVKDKNPTHHRNWLAVLAVLTVFAFGAAGLYLWRGHRKSVDAPMKTLAVLPFKPLVVENRNEALEFGMADTLISKLSGAEVIVRPLSAIRRYNSLEQDSLTAGRELGVDSILDGTIQTWGDRIRISAKLLRTSDGKQLWAGQFDEKFNDIFMVQDSISEKVAAALRIRLGSREKKHSTENIEAYQLYMKGRYHLSKLKPSEMQTATSYYQRAIEIDPSYALAYAELAGTYRVYAISGEKPAREVFPNAKAAAQKAVELDETLAEAHLSLGQDNFWYDWDWSAAENQYRQALELDPSNAIAHLNYALLLSNTGRHAEALAEAKRARELNPLELPTLAIEGQCLLHAGRTDEALDHLKKAWELEPNFWMPHLFAASAYIEKGMYAEAIAESDKEKELSGFNTVPFGAYALAKSGKPEEARGVLEELLKLSSVRYVPPYKIAFIYNALEMRDNALGWLEKAYEERDPQMTFLKVEPKWNNLRSEPRFIDLMKHMKLQ